MDAETRKRLKKGKVRGSSITRLSVFERSKGRCGICGEKIDPALRFPDKRSFTVDHIRAQWGLGSGSSGVSTVENLQATHFSCNAKKAATERPAKPKIYGKAYYSRLESANEVTLSALSATTGMSMNSLINVAIAQTYNVVNTPSFNVSVNQAVIDKLAGKKEKP